MTNAIRMAWLLAVSSITLGGCDNASQAREMPSETAIDCSHRIGHNSDDRAKKGLVLDVEQIASTNSDFLRVLYTGKNLQLVLMTIPPGQHIGAEVDADRDQFYRIDDGHGEVLINGVRTPLTDTSGIIVPAGALHDIVNTGNQPMRVHSLYGPPKRQMNTVRKNKSDAEPAAEHFDGCTTE